MQKWKRLATGALVLGALMLSLVGIASIGTPLSFRHLYEQRYFFAGQIDGGMVELAYARQVGSRIANRMHVEQLGPLGFLSYRVGTNRFNWRYYVLSCPLWMMIGLMLVQPTVAFCYGPVRRRAWRKRNCCIGCGYDRLNLVSKRCPECGTASSCLHCDQDLTKQMVRFCPACGESTENTPAFSPSS